MTKELNVKLTRTINASAKSCFDAWLNPETLKAFMGNCSGISATKVKIDAKVGGEFLIVMKAGEKDIPHTGTYKTINPHTRIEFTWLSPHQTLPDSLVTLDFKSLSDTSTELTLRQVGFASEEARKGHEGGWTEIVGGYVRFFAE